MKRLVKLVRNRVRTDVDDSDVIYEYIHDDEEYIEQLRKKLLEEAAEYLIDPSPNELADVFEVINALREYDLKITGEEFVSIVDKKLMDKGGLDGLGMYVQTKGKYDNEKTQKE